MSLTLTKPVEAVTGMLIRKSARDCYEAFIDPAVTTNFWFTKSTGRLDEDKAVTWTWGMYGVSSQAKPVEIIPNEKIVIEWGNHGDTIRVEWTFSDAQGGTFVNVRVSGFKGDGDTQVKSAIDTTDGFAIVLCGMKAWLEHGIRLNAVGDRWPKGL